MINRSERCAPLRRNLDEGILVNIAVLYICTGEYWRFWQRFRESAAQHLLLGEHVRYFVFSDQDAVRFPGADVVIPQDNLGWPMNTLYRFRMFLRTRAQLQGFDKVIFFNANCEFHAPVNAVELFGNAAELVACRHPGFYDKEPEQFTYERRSQSAACVQRGSVYVAGGLMGGSTSAFLSVCETLRQRIEDDIDQGVLALWHDESHWNAYIDEARANGTNVHLLDPGFLYPEGWALPFAPRIVLRAKSAVIDVHRIKGVPSLDDKWMWSRVVRKVRSLLRAR